MSAVSRNVTPRSRARRMVATDSSQSVAPYHSLIPMQPRPCADTVSWPRFVVRMCVPYSLFRVRSRSGCACGRRFGDAALVPAGLRVAHLEGLPLADQGPADRLAAPPHQLAAF